jgi:hypothetical protein
LLSIYAERRLEAFQTIVMFKNILRSGDESAKKKINV